MYWQTFQQRTVQNLLFLHRRLCSRLCDLTGMRTAIRLCQRRLCGNFSAVNRAEQRIAAQAIGSVILRAALSRRIQIAHVRAVLCIDAQAAHKIMNARLNRNRLFFRVQSQIRDTILTQTGQPVCKHLAGQLCHIQINRRLLPHAPNFPRSHIARHQIAQLRIAFFHEVPRFSVAQRV